MHKSKSSPNTISPSYIDQVYERAKQRLVAAAQAVTEVVPADPEVDSDPRSVEQLLGARELCHVLREPLAWLLSLAEGIAVHDPVDLPAVQRVRAATFSRLAGREAGFRAADVLTVLSLLFGALDPTVVFSAVSGALSDGIAAVLGPEVPVSVYVTSTADPRVTRRTSTVCMHPRCPLRALFTR